MADPFRYGRRPKPVLPRATTQLQISRICTKAPHSENDGAQAELARILERGGRLEDYNLYQCVICDGAWHVGHREPSRAKVPLRPPRLSRPQT